MKRAEGFSLFNSDLSWLVCNSLVDEIIDPAENSSKFRCWGQSGSFWDSWNSFFIDYQSPSLCSARLSRGTF